MSEIQEDILFYISEKQTTLQTTIRLTEKLDYEVGLVKLIYPATLSDEERESIIYVHCNLVESVNIGNKKASVLAALKIEPSTTEYKPSNILYIPTSQKIISEIEIHFKNSKGKELLDDDWLIVLHLRPAMPHL